MKKIFLTLILLNIFLTGNINAQERDVLKSKVVEVLESEDEMKRVNTQIIETGETVEASVIDQQDQYDLQKGDQILITETNGEYVITDYYRTNYLYILFGIFAVLSILVAGVKGISSLLGLASSFFIIFSFIIPYINQGYEPVTITIIGSIFIVAITFYLSHGFTLRTTIAVIGTIISLIITGLLALIFITQANITGSYSEELSFLQAMRPGEFNAVGLLLSGIIIATLGVLDDITISQTAVAAELKRTNPSLEPGELFLKTMNVGKDHIASLVNTLVLVYTGGFLPLLLLITNNPQPFNRIINTEIFAEEIIRTLVSSIGLVLAVPITTALAVLAAEKWKGFWEHGGNESYHYH